MRRAMAGDARQLRLESDADLVQVVTVHKSKGLEYPLVFLPFACTFGWPRASDLPLKWHDEDGCLQLALAADRASSRRQTASASAKTCASSMSR
jgi:exodeoxyribonuclease V beta subunit